MNAYVLMATSTAARGEIHRASIPGARPDRQAADSDKQV
jgi:hypothetical protein